MVSWTFLYVLLSYSEPRWGVYLFFNFYKLEHDLESIQDSHCQDYADSKLVNISANMIHWEASFFPVIKLLSLTTKLWLFWEAEFGHNKNWIVFGPSHLKTRLTKKSFLALLVGVSVRNSVTLSTSTRDKRIKAWKDCRFFFSVRFKHYNNVGLLWDFGWLHRRAHVSFCFIPFLLRREGDASCVWKWLWREHWQMCHREKHTSSGGGTKHTCWEKCCLQNPFWYDSKCLR